MRDRILKFCESLADDFAEGNLDDITDKYVYPLAIYYPTGVRMEKTPAETKNAIFTRRSAALAVGMDRVQVVLHEIGELDGDRFSVLLDWRFLNAEGVAIGESTIRYFCKATTDGHIRVELIEFLKIAFPNADRVWPKSPKTH